MRRHRTLRLAAPWLGAALLLVAFGCGGQAPKETYAVIETSEGRIVCRLYSELLPVTVKVFTSLAQGSQQERQGTNAVDKPMYDGTAFHRAPSGQWLIGGDSTRTVTVFKATVTGSLKHDEPGVLGMVPVDDEHYGGQFYITLAPLPEFDGTHTIFGKVVEGLDVAQAIGRKAAPLPEFTEPDSEPAPGVTIERVVVTQR